MNSAEAVIRDSERGGLAESLSKLLLALADIVGLAGGFFAATGIRFLVEDHLDLGFPSAWQEQRAERMAVFGILSVLVIVWFWLFKGHYTRRKPFWDEMREVIAALLLFALIDASLMFLGKWQFSRLSLGLTWAFVLILIPIGRVIAKRMLLRFGLWQKSSVLIGVGENAINAFLAMQSEPLLGYRFVAAVALNDAEVPASGELVMAGTTLPVSSLESLGMDQFLAVYEGAHVVFAPDAAQSEEERRLLYRLASVRKEISVVPPLRGLPLYGTEVEHFFSHEVLLLHVRNNLDRFAARVVKRSFDVVGSLGGLIFLSPFFLVMFSCLRRPGAPAFFGHERIGRHGRRFKCYKLRTMVPDAGRVLQELLENDAEARAEWERDFKLKDDPRVTPMGNFLRKTSLDELPQLWNVLKGEMSLVGPRPVVEKELAYYGEQVVYYQQVRPGITGLWQISGRNDINYRDRVNLDAWYVRNWSLWYDVVILLKTVRVVLLRKGAY